MNEICLNSDLKLNIQILKNHIIAYDYKTISLYNLNGDLLQKWENDFEINGICPINDNYLLFIGGFEIIEINMNNNIIEVINIISTGENYIYDFLYIKKDNLLILSYKNSINIRFIDTLYINSVQIMNNYSIFLYNFNANLFISYDLMSISIYQRTNNINLYQVLSQLTLDIENFDIKEHINLLKLDYKTLMITQFNKIYLINIQNMIVKQKYSFMSGIGYIDFVYKINKNIYLYKNNYLYVFNYNKNELILINLIYQTNLNAIDYFWNLYIKNKYPYLEDKIRIKCFYNYLYKFSLNLEKIEKENCIFLYPLSSKSFSLFSEFQIKKFLYFYEEKEKKKKRKKEIKKKNEIRKYYKKKITIIKRNNFKKEKIINYPKNFKKNYR